MRGTRSRGPIGRIVVAALVAGACVAAVTVGTGIASASARAGHVHVAFGQYPVVRFDAGEYTQNEVVVLPGNDGGLEIRDNKAPIELTSSIGGCTEVTENTVRCPRLDGVVVRLNLGDFDDTFWNWTELPTLVYAGPGYDSLNGGTGIDEMYGEAGEDKIYGGFGNDRVYGGADNDQVNGGLDDDNVWGGPGTDVLHGNDGDDTLEGDADFDRVYGDVGSDILHNQNTGRDELNGGADDDIFPDAGVIQGGPGDDYIAAREDGEYHGGDGIDTVDYSTTWNAEFESVSVWLNGGISYARDSDCGFIWECHIYYGKHWVFPDVEKVLGTTGNDRIVGGDTDNWLYGRGGNDTVEGKGGNDLVDAGSGNGQKVYGGTGDRDTCRGQNLAHRDPTCELS